MEANHDILVQRRTNLIAKRMMIGAAVALILISALLITVKNADPAWGRLWFLRPLIVVPLAGAMGGLFYHLMEGLRKRGGWNTIIANIISVLVYVFILWVGTILGLDGTLWD